MRVSTRGRYALRAMVDLALHAARGPVSRSDIAERQEISAHYIEQLFVKLRKAGLIQTVKGPGGGYTLARSAEDIKAGDVIRAVEGSIALVYCVEPRSRPPCPRMSRCVTHLLWKKLSKEMANILDSVTLKDLCEQARELEREARP